VAASAGTFTRGNAETAKPCPLRGCPSRPTISGCRPSIIAHRISDLVTGLTQRANRQWVAATDLREQDTSRVLQAFSRDQRWIGKPRGAASVLERRAADGRAGLPTFQRTAAESSGSSTGQPRTATREPSTTVRATRRSIRCCEDRDTEAGRASLQSGQNFAPKILRKSIY